MDAVAILGGTFDPVHLGHIQMAEHVSRKLKIGRVIFIPDGDPPHKGLLAPAKDRLEMVRLAIEGHAGFEVSDMEIGRAGVTYTVDTMTTLTGRYPGVKFVYIVGADTLMVIETWRDFPRVASMLSGIAAVPRKDTQRQAFLAQARMIEDKYRLPVYTMEEEVADISSTDVRFAAARQLPLDEWVPESVEKYIRAKKLYRDPMLTELKRTMTPARYRHTLGVEETAVALAKAHGVDSEKARLAALLHDCAKHMSVEEMCALVEGQRLPLAAGEKDSRALLHAAAGCCLARTRFGVLDPDVLNAIRWHTTGKAGMTNLDKVIYLADMIEPNRRVFPDIERIRAAAKRNLDEAMGIAARRTVEYVKARGMPLNERTLELLKSMEQASDVEGKT